MQKSELPVSRFWILGVRVFRLLCSLKLAVLVILALAIGLAVATVLESLYDTPTAQFWVYHALWFELTLALLGVNIFCVALSRLPWKWRHLPFLLAHLGILILLLGSWITQRKGLDGNLRVTEGDAESVVELDQSYLYAIEQDRVSSILVPWSPPGVRFRPISTAGKNFPVSVTIDQWIPHADSDVSFSARPSEEPKQNLPAVKLRVTGGPMRISQEIWLWQGAPQWQEVQAGPATFYISAHELKDHERPGPWFSLTARDGKIFYLAKGSDGKLVRGSVSDKAIASGVEINPGWKGNVVLALEQWIPDAKIQVDYRPARIQWGPQAPPPAIHVVGAQGEAVWLGLGERAVLHLGQREISLGFFPKRVVLPFSLRLDRFQVEHDPGTTRAAAYSSLVTVLGKGEDSRATISMNEPLQWQGYSIYQASYEDAEPRPVTSIFSVNQDPGRPWKYWGSLLIVLGSILLSVEKYRKSSASKARASGSTVSNRQTSESPGPAVELRT